MPLPPGASSLLNKLMSGNLDIFIFNNVGKTFVSIVYEAQGVLVKNIMSKKKECVKANPKLPVDGRIYGARQSQLCEKTLPITSWPFLSLCV
jgi:hypothetical protein